MSTATVNSVDLDKIAADYKKAYQNVKRRIIICGGTGCVANGSLDVRDALAKELEKAGIDVILEVKAEDRKKEDTYISKSGCQGFCQMGPLLHIEPGDILYTKVKIADVPEIVERTLQRGEIIDRLLYVDHKNGNCHCKGDAEIPFYNRQKRVVLANCRIEPGDVREYIARGGYFGARKAVLEMKPEEVCRPRSNPACAAAAAAASRPASSGSSPSRRRTIRSTSSGNGRRRRSGRVHGPLGHGGQSARRHRWHDDAARATARAGYVYVRAEYPLAVERMRAAVKDAEAIGVLGDNLFGSDFSFRVNVMEGAGAFVCGEETALIASIEGKRGMPKPKPPFPAQSGLWGKPTVINNVETLASDSGHFPQGSGAVQVGRHREVPRTKTFALTGHVANTGLIEVPFGTTLREIVYNIGGGVTNNAGEITNEDFKAVQIGGPSGGCLTPEMLDLPLDFDSLKSVGAMVGSGGLVVMNKQTCIVKIARFFMQFTQNESCGKCVPCREGTRQMARAARRHHRRARRPSHARAARGDREGGPARVRSAASARPPRTRCSRRCAISAKSTKRTSSRRPVRPANARRWPGPKFWPTNARAARPHAQVSGRGDHPARSRKFTSSMRTSASSAAPARRPANSARSSAFNPSITALEHKIK